MTSSILYRWAGSALIGSAILFAIEPSIHPPHTVANVTTAAWAIAHYLGFLSPFFTIPGMFGLYTKQAKETKGLGFLGFILIFVAMTLLAGAMYFEAFVIPALAGDAPAFVEKVFSRQVDGPLEWIPRLFTFAFSLGWLLFGWATVRAGVLPPRAAWAALLGGVVLGFGRVREAPVIGPLAALIFGVGLAWLGNALRTEKRT